MAVKLDDAKHFESMIPAVWGEYYKRQLEKHHIWSELYPAMNLPPLTRRRKVKRWLCCFQWGWRMKLAQWIYPLADYGDDL